MLLEFVEFYEKDGIILCTANFVHGVWGERRPNTLFPPRIGASGADAGREVLLGGYRPQTPMHDLSRTSGKLGSVSYKIWLRTKSF